MNSKASSRAANPLLRRDIKTRPQGRLVGPSSTPDPRVHAWRSDLAAIGLVGIVVAPRYAAPVAMRCGVSVAPLRTSGQDEATQVSEILPGEAFDVFEIVGDWAWGQGASDGYVGWTRLLDLSPRSAAASQEITVPQGLVFAAASIKSPVVAVLPLGARVETSSHDQDFHRIAGIVAGFVHRRHLARQVGDAVDLARCFIGTPYHWGGRTRAGIDCSGLTQAVLRGRGVPCPRDTDQQRDAFETVAYDDRRRGDLVWTPGHIGILSDPSTLLHANAFWMATVAEPLADVLARQTDVGVSILRPPCDPLGLTL